MRPQNISEDAPAIACVAVTADQAWLVETPGPPAEQKGEGDAFMALFVMNVLRTKGDFPKH
jgi:hypothetical protein